jgi:chemotaxis protein CheD
VTATEVMVRMGELATSAVGAETLVSLALGSCIGVAMVDRRRGLAGLAHVMLPESSGPDTKDLGRFADTAVPELLRQMVGLGALRTRLEVSLVGGAQMFSFNAGGATAVGPRNDAAVREALDALRLPVSASCTGGSQGRTIRVDVASGDVYVKAAGGAPWLLEKGMVK